MNQAMDLISAVKWSEVAFAAVIAVFLYVYTVLAPWWRNPIGRTVAYKDIIILWLLAVGFGNLWLHLPVTVTLWFYLAGLLCGTAVMAWRCVVFTRERHEALKRAADSEGWIRALAEELASAQRRAREGLPARDVPPMPRTLAPFVAAAVWVRSRLRR